MYRFSRLFLIFALLACGYSIALFTAMYWPQSGSVLAGIVALYFRGRGRREWTTLGSARWENHRNLRRAGMLDADSGLILGRLLVASRGGKTAAILGLFHWRLSARDACRELLATLRDDRGPLVRLPNAIHTTVFSPSGGGKGVSLVIPFLRTCPESCVVLDFKGENAKLTAEHRRTAFGHQIVMVDPYKVATQAPDSFDPLCFIDRDDPQAIDDCLDLAKSIVVRRTDEKEPHWNDSAEIWLAAIIAVVVMYGNAPEGTRSLQTVRDILSNPQKLELAIKLLLESTLCGGMLARMGGQLTHFIEKEKSSTMTTVSRHLRFLDTLAVAQSTKTSSFDPALLRSGKMTVYLILPPERMAAQAPLLRLWIVSMLRAVVRGGLQERNKVHLLLDEAASLGHLEAIDDAVDKYRGYGVRMQFYYQSMGQLKKCFPDGQDQTLLSNSTQIFFGVNDHGLAGGVGTGDYVSARLGEKTVVVDSGGNSAGRSSQWSSGGGQQSSGGSHSINSSDNWNQQARRLLKPEEVVALPTRVAITFTPGLGPICTKLSRYYEEPDLGMPKGVRRRNLAAVGTLLLAIFLCALSLGLAARVRYVATQDQIQRREQAFRRYEQRIRRIQRPAVPVEPHVVFSQEQQDVESR